MAAPTVDNTGQGVNIPTSFPQNIQSFPVGAAANRLLFVGIGYFNATSVSVSGVTFNTTNALTKLDRLEGPHGTGFETIEIWYFKNPPNVTGDIIITWGSNPSEAFCGATSWFGVDQTTPFGAVAKNNLDNTSTAPTVSVPVTTIDRIIHDAVASDEFPGVLVATGTQRWNGHSGVNGTACAGQTKPGTGSAVTMDWSQAGSGKTWSIMGVPINGIVSGAPPISPSDMTPSNEMNWRFM